MNLRCKHCSRLISLTERESAALAADLDRRFSWTAQSTMTFRGVCADCWPLECDRLIEAQREGHMRIQVISATI